MTLPNTENLTLVRGDDYSQAFEFTQTVSSFTQIYFTARVAYATYETDNSAAAFSAMLGSGISAIGSNTVQLDITHAQSLTLTAASYYYDIQVLTTTGKIYTTQRGMLRVLSDVTR